MSGSIKISGIVQKFIKKACKYPPKLFNNGNFSGFKIISYWDLTSINEWRWINILLRFFLMGYNELE